MKWAVGGGLFAVIYFWFFLRDRNIFLEKIFWSMLISLVKFMQIPSSPFFWIFFIFIFIYLLFQSGKLRLVSGFFSDDFKEGLGKWEYGDEGWKQEQEDGKWLLKLKSF